MTKVAFFEPLGPNARECLLQLFISGPTWDGYVVSKSGRDELIKHEYAARSNGWAFLTASGIDLALLAGFDREKDRRIQRGDSLR